LDKIVRFDSINSFGEVFAEAVDVTARGGGGLTKSASQMPPEIAAFLRQLKPDPRYQYVWMTPMGAFEFWGMNVNGDVFPEISLSFDRNSDRAAALNVSRVLEQRWLSSHGIRLPSDVPQDFGFRTFLEARRYLHHVNKNPEIAYGDIVLSIWNPGMRRVEVIARHDRQKADKVGAGDVIRDLDQGKPRQISMGCRVPFDVCTICGHISKTPHDYCHHLKSSMGTTMPDGRIVGAVNFYSRFFDLSDVFVPAAKESGVLAKVASARVPVKVAVQKVADHSKTVTPNQPSAEIQRVTDSEPAIPDRDLLRDAFPKILAALTAMGIVLRPEEFQTAALHSMGEDALSAQLKASNNVFRSVPYEGPSPKFDLIPDPNLMRSLSGLLAGRSALQPMLPQRILRITICAPARATRPTEVPENTDALTKISSMYSAYRQSLIHLPDFLTVAVSSDPEYYNSRFFGELLTSSMQKAAGQSLGRLNVPSTSMYIQGAYRDTVVEPPLHWGMEKTPDLVKTLLKPPFWS
jgi:hypothetical protein